MNAREEHNETQRRYYATAEKRGMQPTGSPYLNRHVDELVRFAGIEPGQRVLEVGCGIGRYTLLLAERGIRVEGIDLSQPLLDRLADFNAGRFDIPLHAGDVLAPPVELGNVDAVIGFFTLHHIHDLAATYRAMTALVESGGPVTFSSRIRGTRCTTCRSRSSARWRGRAIAGCSRCGGRSSSVRWRRPACADLRHERFGFFPPFAANAAWGPRPRARSSGAACSGPCCRSSSSVESAPAHDGAAGSLRGRFLGARGRWAAVVPRRVETRDESWFLQVTARVSDGDSLYRDVFYATTPFAVYVTLPFVWLLGAQAFWVKTLVAGCFAASLFLLVRIGRRPARRTSSSPRPAP